MKLSGRDTDISQNQSNSNNQPYSSKLAQLETQVQNQSVRIDSLEMKWASDTDINQNQSNSNNKPYFSKLAQLETQFQNQSVRIDSLEMKWTSDSDIRQNQSDPLKHLKSDIEQYGDRIAKLESEMSNILDNSTELDKLDSSTRNNDSYIMSEIDTKIRSVTSVVQKYNSTLTDLGNRLTALETNESVDVKFNSETTELDASMRSVISVLQEYNDTLTNLGKRIIELETNTATNSGIITEPDSKSNSTTLINQTNNDFLTDLSDRIINLESQTSLIQNNSNRITGIGTDLKSITSVIQDHGDIFQDL